MTIGFNHGHDLDREFSSSNMKFAMSQPKVVRRSGVVIYQILTGVTSNVGVSSTHLVELERRSKAQNVGNVHGYLSGPINFRYNFR